MVQHRSYITSADNTGARWLQLFAFMAGTAKRYAVVGDVVTAVVKDAQPHAATKKRRGPRGYRAHQKGDPPPGRFLHPL